MPTRRRHLVHALSVLVAAISWGCSPAQAPLAIPASSPAASLSVQALNATELQIDLLVGAQRVGYGTLRLQALQLNGAWVSPGPDDRLSRSESGDVAAVMPIVVSDKDTDQLGGVQLRLDLEWMMPTLAPRYTQFGYAKFSAAGVLDLPTADPLDEQGILPPMVWRSDLGIDELLRQSGLAPGICWWTTTVQPDRGGPFLGIAAGRARHLPVRLAPWRTAASGMAVVIQIGGLGESLQAPRGDSFDLEPLLLAAADQYDALQEQLADHFESEYVQRPRRAITDTPRMYTTWHADFEKLSHDGILGHLDHLKQTGLDQSINAFQIDDGYQQHWGDWLTTSAQFGTDLTTIATEIRARGFEPGLWLAPPLVAADSAIARRHPDWILRRDGRPVRCDTCNTRGIKLYVLDFGNDEVTNWLEQTMARLQDAGFSLFKLDFLATAVAVGASAATDTTGLDRFHRMLAAIRRGARPGTFLWSATQPLFPTLGALDGYRVSGDLGFPFFDDLPLANWYHYARTLALRAPWLNRWGIIDPDGFFLRGQPDASRRRTLLWLDAMAGGIYAIGDRDADLSAAHSPSALPQPLRDGIGTGVSWIPIDPFAYPIRTWTPSPVVEQLITVDRNTDAQPPFWFHRCGSDACVIAVNWAPFQRTVALPASHLTRFGAGSWTVADSWGNGMLFESRSELRFDLPAMGAMAVRLARR